MAAPTPKPKFGRQFCPYQKLPTISTKEKGSLKGCLFLFKANGDPRRTRTFDPMVKSHLLYRLSYRTTFQIEVISTSNRNNDSTYRNKTLQVVP